ncbi:MAG: hypothetical protein M3Q75_15295 [Gemmatimonadota bacterium]|nr:hypothetical protein [Gemmatimonadota bacterium]
MAKIGIVVLTDTETHGDLGRVVNALITAKEATEAGDEIRLVFDGAGTKWIGELAQRTHRSHSLYRAVKDSITGACRYCSTAFGAKDAVETERVPLLDEYEDHPSLRKLVADGFEVLVF